jgi:DNA primase
MQNRSSSSPVEQIKDRLSIEDVISSYLTLIPTGLNFKAKCPFHNEKTASFFISPSRNSYYCFGCNAKGDIFSFVEQFEGVDFKGALKILALRAGVTLTNFQGEKKDDLSILYEIMEEATIFFENEFAGRSDAREYLKGRGLTDETIKNFRIGYAKPEWRLLSEHLLAKGFKESDIERAGLIKRSEKGIYDRFRARIMFPIADSSGRVIAFSGRTFGSESDIEEAKYLNSPETPLFSKTGTLYGIDKAKLAIKKRGYSIIVEGQLDLLLSHQIGFTNTVAVSGTALASSTNDGTLVNNLGLVRRLSPNVIFAFDGDAAGVRAVGRSSHIAFSLDMQVKVAKLPEGKDPADVIKEMGDEWKSIIAGAEHVITFFLNRICKEEVDQRKRGKAVRDIIFPYILSVKSAMDKSAYMMEIHRATNIPEQALIEDFESYKRTPEAQKSIEENTISVTPIKNNPESVMYRRFFAIVSALEKMEEVPKNFQNIQKEFKNIISEEKYKEISEPYNLDSETLAFEAQIWYGSDTDLMLKDLKELAMNIEENILANSIEKVREKIHEHERGGDRDKVTGLLKEYQELVSRVQAIKSQRSQ